MKQFALIILSLSFMSSAFAQNNAVPFVSELESLFNKMVKNDSEISVTLKVYNQESTGLSPAEAVNAYLGKGVSEADQNLELITLDTFNKAELIKDVMAQLFKFDSPFFCATIVEDSWNSPSDDKCKEKTLELLENSLKNANDVLIYNYSGDYYGNYAYTVLILTQESPAKTVAIEFPHFFEI